MSGTAAVSIDALTWSPATLQRIMFGSDQTGPFGDPLSTIARSWKHSLLLSLSFDLVRPLPKKTCSPASARVKASCVGQGDRDLGLSDRAATIGSASWAAELNFAAITPPYLCDVRVVSTNARVSQASYVMQGKPSSHGQATQVPSPVV